jgi:hypothetical protein
MGYGLWLYYRLHQEVHAQWYEELIVKGIMAQTNVVPLKQYSSTASTFLEIQVLAGLPVQNNSSIFGMMVLHKHSFLD